jgi:hypothetical protein
VISVPGEETKNGEPTEHFLLEDVAVLLDLYLEKYLPIIANGPSPWLFPGKTTASCTHIFTCLSGASFVHECLRGHSRCDRQGSRPVQKASLSYRHCDQHGVGGAGSCKQGA